MTITIEFYVGTGADHMSKTVTFENVTAENVGAVATLIERVLVALSE